MADDFDRLLAGQLAPPGRLPDRQFVSRVDAAIRLDGALAAQRRAHVATFVKQLAALLSIAAGLWCISEAAPVAKLFAEAPALVLALLLIAFMLVVGLLASRSEADGGAPFTILNGS